MALHARLCAILCVSLLAGCATFSSDGGFEAVADITRQRTGQQAAWQRNAAQSEAAQARVAALLQQPLTADAAVQLALLNNRGLQARYAELGIAEADLVRAGRIGNPRIGFARIAGGGVTEIDRSVLFDVLGLITMPLAAQLEQQRFAQTQLRAAADTISLAADTRRAFFAAVATQQLVGLHQQAKDATSAAAELAHRTRAAGNISPLAQMRQQAVDNQATVQLAQAKHQAVAQREKLVRLLGLTATQLPGLTLIAHLPALPAAPLQQHDAEQAAIAQRLDVRLATRQAESTARALGLTQATGFVNVLELGYANKSQTGDARQNGYEITLELPLFDFGMARSARAEAVYRQAMDNTAQVAVDAQSDVREAYSAYRTAYALAQHYQDTVLPLSRRMSEENLLLYNGMLISAFDLLAEAREQFASAAGQVQALRDHWLALTDLQTALAGPVPVPVPVPVPASPPVQPTSIRR